MKLYRDGAEWGGSYGDRYWIWWWNILPPELRYMGYTRMWHDGPISTFGWWFGNISWRLPWTNHDGGIGSE